MMAGAPVAILDLEDKDHTLDKADQRSRRSLGPSNIVTLSYQLYLQCYLRYHFVFLLFKTETDPK